MNERYFDNLALVDSTNDGQALACNAVGLNEGEDTGQYVDVGILHVLGEDTYSGAMTANGNSLVMTDLTNGDYNLRAENTPDTKTIVWRDSKVDDVATELSFTAVINEGAMSLDTYYNGVAYVPLPNGTHTVAEGLNKITVGAISDSTGHIYLNVVKNVLGDVDINDSEAHTVTNNNSFINHLHPSTGVYETIDLTSIPGTFYRQVVSFQGLFPSNIPLSQADRDALEANPNLIMDVWFDGATLPSGFSKANMVAGEDGLTPSFLVGNDAQSGATVHDIGDALGDATIVGYTQRLTNGQIGISDLQLVKDASGVPTATADANTAEFLNNGGKIETRLKPNLNKYTIYYTLKVNGVDYFTCLKHDADGVGPEEMTNPNFDDGTTGWTSVAVNAGVMNVLNGEGYQTLTVTAGKTYSFSCICDRAGVSPSISVKADTPTGGSLFVVHPSGTGYQPYSGEFTATTNTVVVHLGNGSNTALFDDFSIKELNAEVNEYKIDDVVQATPALPSPSVNMVLDETPLFGFSGEATDHTNCMFKFITSLTTDGEDTIAYSEWADCAYPNPLTLIEQQNGYCDFPPGGSCTEDSLIVSAISMPFITATYSWTITGATISGSTTEDYITVSTPEGNTPVEYEVTLDAVINGLPFQKKSTFTQVKETAPIRILDILEDAAGSCTL